MRVRLLFDDLDFDPNQAEPWSGEDLIEDLGLEAILELMADGDPSCYRSCRSALLHPLAEIDQIRYRQEILRDCLDLEEPIQRLYQIAESAVIARKKAYAFGVYSKSPTSMLRGAVGVLGRLSEYLEELSELAARVTDSCRSPGLTRFFAGIRRDLTPDTLRRIRGHVASLKFDRGLEVAASVGDSGKGTSFTLQPPPAGGRLSNLGAWVHRDTKWYSFELQPRDEAGFQYLANLADQGTELAARAALGSADSLVSFFNSLLSELGFYIGAMRLHHWLESRGLDHCVPSQRRADPFSMEFEGLYDIGLVLAGVDRPVANDLQEQKISMLLITGANSGGKSTFLRSVGVAQLLMQAGIEVPARRFSSSVVTEVLTHFRRDEDPTLTSGRLYSELERMALLVNRVSRGAMVLSTETFHSTGESDGSRLASEVFLGLMEIGAVPLIVTHLYGFAREIATKEIEGAVLLRAERLEDTTRTFRIVPGLPQATSHGWDLLARSLSVGQR